MLTSSVKFKLILFLIKELLNVALNPTQYNRQMDHGLCDTCIGNGLHRWKALNVALPSLQEDLNATGTDLFWVLNSYLLMLAALILTGGSLGDKLGTKKVFMTGITIFIIGSAS